MTWITTHIKWIMLVSGVLTCTMVYAALAPEAALLSTFGEELAAPGATIVVRNWGALITLVGGMLIYGAYHAESRALVLVVAGLSKLIFVGLVLAHGARFLSHQAGVAVAVDAGFVLLFATYLARRPGR